MLERTLSAVTKGSWEGINELADEATAHLARRLVADEPNRLAAFQIETDIIENFQRLNTLTRRIAQMLLELATGRQNEPQDLRLITFLLSRLPRNTMRAANTISKAIRMVDKSAIED